MIKDKTIQNLVDTGLLEDKRIFTTNKSYSRFLRPRKSLREFKPMGLWYSIGSSWIDWCLGENYEGVGKYVYEIELNPKANILFLTRPDEVFSFSEKYKRIDGFYANFSSVCIDWKRVMGEYDGIEISPYLYKLRFVHDLIWYYGWDIPSGCMWKTNAKKKITLLAEYKEKRKNFVIL